MPSRKPGYAKSFGAETDALERAITIAVGDEGKPLPVNTLPVRRDGVWALHRAVGADGHAVTHVPSGRSVFTGTESAAARVYETLALMHPSFWADARFADLVPRAERSKCDAVLSIAHRGSANAAQQQEAG